MGWEDSIVKELKNFKPVIRRFYPFYGFFYFKN